VPPAAASKNDRPSRIPSPENARLAAMIVDLTTVGEHRVEVMVDVTVSAMADVGHSKGVMENLRIAVQRRSATKRSAPKKACV
jgi:hypothetical protein